MNDNHGNRTDEEERAHANVRSREEWNAFFESSVRISLASIGGLLVGYGLGAKKQPTSSSSFSGGHQSNATSGPFRRHRPPTTPAVGTAPKVLMARSWGLSCFLFALILETARLVSPTKALLNQIMPSNEGTEQQGQGVPKYPPSQDNLQTLIQREAITSLGDYTVGGSIAGLAGGRAWIRNAPSTARQGPFLVRGVMAGALLGLTGGIAQAGLDAIIMYEEAQQREKEQRETEQNNSVVDNP
mmetsp:Transcript_1469/g.2026  ORF Transcript_1469/g.2026 Transcript_1469/m.2026 type:complete len:243 (-) Transcript_1469:245-973(-)